MTSFSIRIAIDKYGIVEIELADTIYYVYARSYLHYGSNEFLRMQAERPDGTLVTHTPCMPTGATYHAQDPDGATEYHLTGTGNPAACWNLTLDLMGYKTSCSECPADACQCTIKDIAQPPIPSKMGFQALSGYVGYDVRGRGRVVFLRRLEGGAGWFLAKVGGRHGAKMARRSRSRYLCLTSLASSVRPSLTHPLASNPRRLQDCIANGPQQGTAHHCAKLFKGRQGTCQTGRVKW